MSTNHSPESKAGRPFQAHAKENAGALVLMPTPPTWSTGPVATWVTAAGWTRALGRALGSAQLVTPVGSLTADEAERLVARRDATSSATSTFSRKLWRRVRGLVPEDLHTARKDTRDLLRAVAFLRHAAQRPSNLRLVWQHHELFQNAGLLLARRAGVPLIQFVDAPIVWEAERWGVRRPWGAGLERVAESPQLRFADLVACVSEDVRSAAIRLGANPARAIVTPCAVDVERFSVAQSSVAALRRQLGIRDEEIVVGWLGSFRRFHGVELLLEAMAEQGIRDRATLLLVGDGQERASIEQKARTLGLRVILTGLVPYQEVMNYVGVFDVAVVTAPAGDDFHYSPLKLKEYMAAGRAIIAPRVGEIPDLLEDGVDAILVDRGDFRAIATALRELIGSQRRRKELGGAARKKVEAIGTWDAQVRHAFDVLERLGWSGLR